MSKDTLAVNEQVALKVFGHINGPLTGGALPPLDNPQSKLPETFNVLTYWALMAATGIALNVSRLHTQSPCMKWMRKMLLWPCRTDKSTRRTPRCHQTIRSRLRSYFLSSCELGGGRPNSVRTRISSEIDQRPQVTSCRRDTESGFNDLVSISANIHFVLQCIKRLNL